MDRKQIKQWALEADAGFYDESLTNAIVGMEAIERFAALVAAHERNRCAVACETKRAFTRDHAGYVLLTQCATAIRALT